MNKASYYWERRNVIKRITKNWLQYAFHEPFRRKGKHGETAIIFVRQNARSRIFNHGYVLRKNEGIRTVLLTRFFDYAFQREAFDEIYIYYNKADLQKKVHKLALRYRILATVGSTQPAWTTRALLEMPRNWPVLIDQYDSYWACIYFAGLDPTENKDIAHLASDVADEQFCFCHADGVIARSGELPILFEEQGITTPYILIEDGCNPIFFQPLKPHNGPKGEEWSVVYAGIILPMSLDPRYGDTQFVPLGKFFAQERIHFHLYPSPHHNYQYPEYETEAASNPYFHMHPAVDFGKVHREIARYDFGWFAFDSSKNAFASDIYLHHGISAKLFTYFEAGLPVITNEGHARRAQIVDQTGAGIIIDTYIPRGLRATVERQNLPDLIQGVERARAASDVNRRSGELLAFIRDVRKKYERSRK